MEKNTKTKAFTLIELLVVIAIIGLLASIVLIALNSARAKSRDAKRVADLKELQSALELYYNDHGQYPQVEAESTPGSEYYVNWPTLLSTYVATMPSDPINAAGSYGYYYSIGQKETTPCSFAFSLNDYVLGTRLENPSSIPNSCPSGYSAWDNANLNFIEGN